MQKSLNLISPINKTGYGIVGKNILKQLARKVNVALWPIGGTDYDPDIHETYLSCLNNSHTYDHSAPSLRHYHLNEMALFPQSKGKRYGFTHFELDKFTENEIMSSRDIDHLIVCSQWAKEICDKELKVQTSVVPLGVDSEIFKQIPVAGTQETIFFNCGKWEVRKGHDFLLDVFNTAFEKTDNVRLIMNCENPFIGLEGNLEWISQYKNSKLGGKIDILPRFNSQQEVCKMMNSVDCGVFPAHAEGWNLEALEMLACGRHIIITDCTAHKEFVNNKNARLLTVGENEPAYARPWFNGQGNWPSLTKETFEQCIEHMRAIHKLKQGGRLTFNIEGLKTAKKFSWENTANKILEVMEIG